jgi:RNA polymerase sigma factor (sigma-70 family)
MLNRRQKVVLPHLCRLIASPGGGELADGDLLGRFLGRRDAAAFAALVRRHGPTVLGVCRRVLHNAHDAEDAFQATFLVLARKAGSIARQESVGNWLYGVACRVALKARADAARRRKHERQAAHQAPHQPERDGAWDDVRPILDEEVNRLPDKYRRPVVLCYFEGKTYQEAARLLGWPAGTASVRLARAREMLRHRLALRGLALSASALACCLAEGPAAAAEVSLLADATASVAVAWLADPAAAGVSTRVIALTEGVVNAMLLRHLKILAGVLVVIAATLGGGGALWRVAVMTPAAAADRRSPSGESGTTRAADAEPSRPAEGPLGAPPRALAPAAGEGTRPVQSRIGLINLTRVLKSARKFWALQAELRAKTEQARHNLDVLRKQAQQYQAEFVDPATPAGRREELNRKIVQIKREIEDEQEGARARVARMSGDALTATYKEVEEAARRIANVKGLELVLFYTDAVTEADFYNPDNLQRKMTQPGALVPLVAAPGMDITDAVIGVLNRTTAPSDGTRP